MLTSADAERELHAKYRILQRGAMTSTLVLLPIAILANWLYQSGFWFVAGAALCGLTTAESWRLAVREKLMASALIGSIGLFVSVIGLSTEASRSTAINLACGFSVMGSLLFLALWVVHLRNRKKTGAAWRPREDDV